MKKIFYTIAIIGIGAVTTAKAQVNIGVSIGTPAPVYAAPAPVWIPQGPASSYYFFPDINCYYDMSLAQYIYFENNRWTYGQALPPRYRGYNFGRGRIMPMSRMAFGYRGIPRYNAGPSPMMQRNRMMMDRRNNYVMQQRPQMNHGWNGGGNSGNHNGWNNNGGGRGHDDRGRGGRR